MLWTRADAVGSAVPLCGLLAAWGTAALRGQVAADAAAAALAGDGLPHRVSGVPGEGAPVSWPVALPRLRRAGTTGLRVVLPVPGDPAGLPGPPAVNERALAAGQAALAVGGPPLALLPVDAGPAGRGVHAWEVVTVDPGPPPAAGLAEADRALAEALHEATATLAALGLDRPRDGLARRLAPSEAAAARLELPPATSQRALRVLRTALRVRALVAVAAEDDGAAVSAGEAGRRAAALRRVDDAARRATAAALSAAAVEVPR